MLRVINKICKVIIITAIIGGIISSLILTGCTQTDITEENFTIEITDQLGRVVTLSKTPERIISLAPSNTEILFALGLEDKVIAVTDYCNYPPAVQDKPSIGGFSTPNIEEIIALSPDLIIAASIHEEKIIPQLEEKGIVVFGLDPKTIDQVITAISLAGQVTGNEKEADNLISEMQSRIKAVTDKTGSLTEEQKKRICYLVWHEPPMLAGSGTIQSELIEMVGGINVAKNLNGYAKISLEEFIATNPQVMIAGTSHGAGEDLTLQFLKTEPRLSSCDARQTNQIYGVNADIAGRPGPRIVEALEEFAKNIHPELFE